MYERSEDGSNEISITSIHESLHDPRLFNCSKAPFSSMNGQHINTAICANIDSKNSEPFSEYPDDMACPILHLEARDEWFK